MGLAEALRLVAFAKVAIGMHGSILILTMFMAPGSTVRKGATTKGTRTKGVKKKGAGLGRVVAEPSGTRQHLCLARAPRSSTYPLPAFISCLHLHVCTLSSPRQRQTFALCLCTS